MLGPSRLTRALTVLAITFAATGCGPSPANVCAHIESLAKQEASPGATVELDDADCAAALEKKREQLGSAAWGQKASCLLDAGTLAALDAC